MHKNQIDTKILNALFDPSVREKVTRPIEPVSIANNDKNLIGYSEIQAVEAIYIDEITFGNQLITISDSIEKAMYLIDKNMNMGNKNKSIEINKILENIHSSHCMAEILQIGNSLSTKYEDITKRSHEIRESLVLLKNTTPKLQAVIDTHINSNDPAIQMRINMLKQFSAFQDLRIKSIESNLNASKTTLKNCTDFLSFTLPNITYSLQNKLYNVDLSQSLEQYNKLNEDFQSAFNKKQNELMSIILVLSGSSISYFCYSIFGLSPNVKMVAGMFFYIGIFILAISFICLAIQFFSLEKASKETLNSLYFLFGSSLTGLIITCMDIFIFNLSILKYNLLTFSLGIISTVIVISLVYYLKKSWKMNSKNTSENNAIVNQLLEMEKQYKSVQK